MLEVARGEPFGIPRSSSVVATECLSRCGYTRFLTFAPSARLPGSLSLNVDRFKMLLVDGVMRR
jgi:hypothetical protein